MSEVLARETYGDASGVLVRDFYVHASGNFAYITDRHPSGVLVQEDDENLKRDFLLTGDNDHVAQRTGRGRDDHLTHWRTSHTDYSGEPYIEGDLALAGECGRVEW